jgi:hypothetical protein
MQWEVPTILEENEMSISRTEAEFNYMTKLLKTFFCFQSPFVGAEKFLKTRQYELLKEFFKKSVLALILKSRW